MALFIESCYGAAGQPASFIKNFRLDTIKSFQPKIYSYKTYDGDIVTGEEWTAALKISFKSLEDKDYYLHFSSSLTINEINAFIKALKESKSDWQRCNSTERVPDDELVFVIP